jgi:iron(III) transport system substrate-binding protein
VKRALRIAVLSALSALAACAPPRDQVVVYTSVDQVFSEPILKEFERRSGLVVHAVYDTEETKSTGVLNRLIAEGKSPQADLFWSGDPVRPFLLVKRDLVVPYSSPVAARIPAAFKAADGTWTGFAARARVLLVNKDRIGTGERPTSVKDLADPRWRGQTAIANPLYGTTTMHAAALFAAWGDAEAMAFFDRLKANGARIASSNGEVKRLVAAGEVTFGLTDTDDASEALKDGAPVEVVFPDQDDAGTLLMPTAAVLIKGGPHPDAARKLVDYLVSADVERRMAEEAAHLPLGSDVEPPAGFKRVDELKTLHVDYARVADEVERIEPWMREWVDL